MGSWNDVNFNASTIKWKWKQWGRQQWNGMFDNDKTRWWKWGQVMKLMKWEKECVHFKLCVGATCDGMLCDEWWVSESVNVWCMSKSGDVDHKIATWLTMIWKHFWWWMTKETSVHVCWDLWSKTNDSWITVKSGWRWHTWINGNKVLKMKWRGEKWCQIGKGWVSSSATRESLLWTMGSWCEGMVSEESAKIESLMGLGRSILVTDGCGCNSKWWDSSHNLWRVS